MGSKEHLANEQELGELAAILGEQFIQRWDLYARQLADGRYTAVKRPLQQVHLQAHLRGEMTLGSYVLDGDSRTRMLVVDADDEPDWRRLQALTRALQELGCRGYLERSRRGGHLWLFFAEARPGTEVRRFGQGLLAHFGIEEIELFPKQDRLRTGPGSLIRLPFGVHQKSGRRYGFYTAQGQALAPTLRAQMMALRAVEPVPEPVFAQFWELGRRARRKPVFGPADAAPRRAAAVDGGLSLSAQLKAAVSVRDFVLRYVELSPRGMGRCPFHADEVASFSVNDEHNFWHCFACGTGGSIIDFWMAKQRCDFTTAVRELREMLLVEDGVSGEVEPGVADWGGEPLALG